MDFKSLILSELSLLAESEKQNRNPFKARAYEKVIKSIQRLSRPIHSMNDLEGVEGIGKSIQSKIKEMIERGGSSAAQAVREDPRTNAYLVLQGIYGIGPAHSRSLLERYPDIRTIDDVRKIQLENPGLFTRHQKAGIEWYEDLQKRIPRSEMMSHEKYMTEVSREYGLILSLSGSYRRGNIESGDIDCILTHSASHSYEDGLEYFCTLVKYLCHIGYIRHIFAHGRSKVLCICQLSPDHPGRRLDLLFTERSEYPYALLYFTGSQRLNIEMRKRAMELGYTLNEHEMCRKDRHSRVQVKSEEEIFKILGMKYLEPSERNI